MNKLEYHFECLDGRYFLTAINDENIIRYTIETDIEGFESREGELSLSESQTFINEVKAANIERWDREYGNELSKIEDGIEWKVVYCVDDKEYVSKGFESYEPYGYESLIAALKLCEEKASYFAAGADE